MKYPNLELIEYISKQILKNENPSALYPTCTMYVFPQTWSSTALGFDGCGGQAITEAYTTVVEMTSYKVESGKDIKGKIHVVSKELENKVYAVFFDGKIAYMCLNPNSEFFRDFDRMCMKPQRGAEYYVDENLNGEYEYSRVSIL